MADEKPRLLRRQADAEEYCTVVARWNEHVQRSDERVVDFVAYCSFLLEAYDELRAPIVPLPVA